MNILCPERKVYLDRGSLTRWLTNPSDELSNFCVVFAETEVIDKQISFQQHDRSVTCLTLDKYAPNPFICLWQTYSVVQKKKTIQFVVNTLYKK